MSDASAGQGRGTGGTASDFPTFVADLVQGVFQSIVGSSIQQMEAFGDLVKSVAESLNDFAGDVARTGAECLDGLCSARAWTHTAAPRAEPGEGADSTSPPASEREA